MLALHCIAADFQIDSKSTTVLLRQSPANIGTIVAVRESAVVFGAVLAVVILKEPMDCCKVLSQPAN